ncbi:MAG: glpD, partial [Neobacillus sp.]|nr:glpD [Neobacillus sp.]
MKFSNINRNEIIEHLKKQEFDVLVIGGGITGAGIALDATTRGMKTALVEMQDFAAGTSSRSTKLIHGGLRYLKQLEVKMVAEVGKERAIVYENGPHVTKPEWMLLPIYQGGTFGRLSTSIGLRVYDFLADVKKTERRVMLSKEQTLEKEPLLKKEGLIGSGYY